MIVGDPVHFAIESGVTQAYAGRGFPALGYFCIHVAGKRFGVFAPDASMLGCSFDAVETRLNGRGSHAAPFTAEPDGGLVADSVYRAIYASEQEDLTFFGMSHEEFESVIHDREIMWAPDGDEAFDDGSFVLQFDVGEQVRLVAFKAGDDDHHMPESLADLWMNSDDFYRILQEWRDGFIGEWQALTQASTTG